MLSEGVIPETEFLQEIEEALSADDVRPLTDNLSVKAPTVVDYDITATYYIENGIDATTIQNNVNEAVSRFVEWEQSKLGRDIVPSRLVQYIMAVNGVKRVEVTSPAYTAVGNTEVPKVETISVTMGGGEDE